MTTKKPNDCISGFVLQMVTRWVTVNAVSHSVILQDIFKENNCIRVLLQILQDDVQLLCTEESTQNVLVPPEACSPVLHLLGHCSGH